MPNINPRMMKQAMKRMGIQQEEIDAVEVIIRTSEKEIIISDPQVSKVNMMGQETWQVTGRAEERSLSTEPEINDEDIKTVMDQANVSEGQARKAIEETKGDIAEAILNLQNADS